MAEPAAIPFAKDVQGRVAINCKGSVIPAKTGGENAATRNHAGRVFLPSDGRAYTILLRDETDGALFDMSYGHTSEGGGTDSVFVRVRGEADVGKPLEPVVEI